MFKEDFEAAANAAVAKRSFLGKNPSGYFRLSVLAGMYIGFGVLLGAELFTGNNLVMAAGYSLSPCRTLWRRTMRYEKKGGKESGLCVEQRRF